MVIGNIKSLGSSHFSKNSISSLIILVIFIYKEYHFLGL